ncbi:MAG: hypothetical protein ACE5JV_03790 [Nitrososphaerales archaeon]
MGVDLAKDNGGWTIKSSDAGGNSSGGLTRGSGGGVSIPGAKDVADFLTGVDQAASGRRYYFVRSDGANMKAYPSSARPGSIVIERAAGNWVRLGADDMADLRMKLTKM